ncbi:MAG: HEAT repeat domain-containing protein [Planctomycetota bacterium]
MLWLLLTFSIGLSDFHGRSALEWASDLGDSDARIRSRAAWALGKMGPEAAPATPALIGALDDSSREVRRRAITTLGEIGPGAEEAIPRLIECLDRVDDPTIPFYYGPPDGRRLAAAALGNIGRASVAPLRAALDDERENVRIGATIALGQLGPNAEDAVPDLVEMLGDDDRLAGPALFALQAIGPKAQAAEQPIRERLGEGGDSALGFAWALAAISPEDELARTTLERELKNESPEARSYALVGLSKTPGAEAALRIGLQDDSPSMRISAAALSLQRSATDPEAIRVLGDLLISQRSIAIPAAVSLLSAGPASAPVFTKVMNDEAAAASVRDASAAALLKLRGDSAARDHLKQAITSADPRRRTAALQTLTIAGPAAVPILRGAMSHSIRRVRIEAAMILLEIDPRDEAAFSMIDGALRENASEKGSEPTSEEQAHIAGLVQQLAESAKERALGIFSHEDPAEVLIDFGAAAVPQLLPLIEDPDPFVRLRAIDMITLLEAGHESALRELIQLTKSENRELAREAFFGLKSLYHPSDQSLVTRLLSDAMDQATGELRAEYLNVIAGLRSLDDEARAVGSKLADENLDAEHDGLRVAAQKLRNVLGGGDASSLVQSLLGELLRADGESWHQVKNALVANDENRAVVLEAVTQELGRADLRPAARLRLASVLSSQKIDSLADFNAQVEAFEPLLDCGDFEVEIDAARQILFLSRQRWNHHHDVMHLAVERLARHAASGEAALAHEARSALELLHGPANAAAKEVLMQEGLPEASRRALAAGIAGARDTGSIRFLIALLGHEDPSIQRAAAAALGEGIWTYDVASSFVDTVLEALRGTLQSRDLGTRIEAAGSILSHLPDDAAATSIVLQGLETNDVATIHRASETLDRYASGDSLGVDGIERMARVLENAKAPREARYRSAQILAKLAGPSLTRLLKTLEDGDRTARIHAAWALRFLGESGRRRNSVWERTLDSDLSLEAQERREKTAFEELVAKDRARTERALEAAIAEADEWVQLYAASSLLTLRLRDETLLAKLVSWLGSEDEELARIAEQEVAQTGYPGVLVLQDTLEADGTSPNVRLRAARALGMMGHLGERALDTAKSGGDKRVLQAIDAAQDGR